MTTATHIKTLTHFQGDAALYQFTPPLEITDWDGQTRTHEYAVLSGVNNGFAFEVMAFPANETGEVTDWSEIACVRNTTDHEAVLDILTAE